MEPFDSKDPQNRSQNLKWANIDDVMGKKAILPKISKKLRFILI